jgi:hypothetical protein
VHDTSQQCSNVQPVWLFGIQGWVCGLSESCARLQRR